MFFGPALWMGRIFAIFRLSGKIPCIMQSLNKLAIIGAIVCEVIFSMYPGMLSGPVALLLFISAMILVISCIVVGYRYID